MFLPAGLWSLAAKKEPRERHPRTQGPAEALRRGDRGGGRRRSAFERDSVVSLIGANGAGKTTFLNMVTGYLRPDSGRIRFDGRDLVGRSPREITAARPVPLVPDPAALPFAQRAREPAGRRRHRRVAEQVERGDRRDARALRARRLTRTRPAGLLPEGIRKLLDVAMALVGQAQAAAARRADQRRRGRREVRHHGSGDGRGRASRA